MQRQSPMMDTMENKVKKTRIRVKWNDELDSALGTITDQAYATKYGIPLDTVARRRNKLDIPRFSYDKNFKWTKATIIDLGRLDYREMKKRYGLTIKEIVIKRREFFVIDPSNPINWSEVMLADLSKMKAKDFALKYNIGLSSVQKKLKDASIKVIKSPSQVERIATESSVLIGYADANELASLDEVLLSQPIDILDATRDTINILRMNNIKTIGELIQVNKIELGKLINFGRARVKEIIEALNKRGLTLA